jgi:8-amino-7-oxononanoate synthase
MGNGIIHGHQQQLPMVNDMQQRLREELAEIESAGLWRRLRQLDSAQGVRINLEGRELLNFSSNDYLGLANDPILKRAASKAIEEFGAGSGSARLICGSQSPHHQLENALAAFKGTESAICFSSGYAAALGVLPVVVGEGDTVIIDKLVHASLIDGVRLSGAKLRVFKHNNLEDLERILQWAARREGHILVITESVFSMDGDLAPILNLVELKEKYGAWLMVDEAHATGLFGKGRRGLIEEFGVGDRVDIQMGTLGKALGSAGGYICGSQQLVDLLINRARSFVFSTAPVPAQAAAAKAAVDWVQTGEAEFARTRLWGLVDQLKNGLIQRGWQLPVVRSAILPLIIGNESDAANLSDYLIAEGVFVPAIRYPTVPRGEARLRITVSAAHSPEDVSQLLEALGNA